MKVNSALHPTGLRRIAAVAALGACALAAAAAPSVASAPGTSAQRASGTTVTMRWYTQVVEFVHVRADGTVVKDSAAQPGAGDTVHIYELGYRGTYAKHAKKWTGSSHTACVFKSAAAPPACEAHIAIGSELLILASPGGGDPRVTGGTGRYRGATGTSSTTEVPGHEDSSDAVITVQLRK